MKTLWHLIISRNRKGDETDFPFLDVPTMQEVEVLVFEDVPKNDNGRRTMNNIKLMYVIFFRNSALL